MTDSRVVDYISQGLDEGHTPQQIRQRLLDAGWSRQQVDEAMRYALVRHAPGQGVQPGASPQPAYPRQAQQGYPQQAYPQQPQPGAGQAGPAQQKPMGVLQKFKLVLVHPGRFFDAVKGEQGYEPPVKFYLLLLLIDIVVMNAIMLFAASVFAPLSGIDTGLGISTLLLYLVSDIVIANLSVVLSIIGTFIGAGLMHVLALIFGARRGYQNTYKAMIYSAAPSIFVWLALGLLLVNVWVAVAAMAAVYIWVMALQIKGLSRFHEISALRAFLIVFTPILVVLVLVGFLLFFMIGLLNPGAFTSGTATGFGVLGAPDNWDLNSDGDFSIVIQNRMANTIEITGIEITFNSTTDSYEPPTPITVEPGLSYALEPAESSLNLGPRTPGEFYHVDVEIEYASGTTGFTLMDFGIVSGTVSS